MDATSVPMVGYPHHYRSRYILSDRVERPRPPSTSSSRCSINRYRVKKLAAAKHGTVAESQIAVEPNIKPAEAIDAIAIWDTARRLVGTIGQQENEAMCKFKVDVAKQQLKQALILGSEGSENHNE